MRHFITLLILRLLCLTALYGSATAAVTPTTSHLQTLQNMFHFMVEKKDIRLASQYYAQDFLLYSNGQTMTYQQFITSHAAIYKTAIQYHVSFDKTAYLEQGDKVAGRVFITVQKPHQAPTKIEVILIAQFKQNKIYRLWELTYPNWSKMPDFKHMSSVN